MKARNLQLQPLLGSTGAGLLQLLRFLRWKSWCLFVMTWKCVIVQTLLTLYIFFTRFNYPCQFAFFTSMERKSIYILYYWYDYETWPRTMCSTSYFTKHDKVWIAIIVWWSLIIDTSKHFISLLLFTMMIYDEFWSWTGFKT